MKFTVRDETIKRVLARDNDEVDNGWLCDKGRFGFQMINSEERITTPRLSGNRADWAQTVKSASDKLRATGAKTAAIVGGQASNEEAYLVQRIVRGLGSPHVTSTDEIDAGLLRDLSAPELAAAITDIDAADSILVIGVDPLHAMPILDLRLRKAIRLSGARVCVASERPTALDGGAEETARYMPGEAAAFLTALASEVLTGGDRPGEKRTGMAADAERLAEELRPGKTVIVWGERLARGRAGVAAMAALHGAAKALNSDAEGSGLIGVPDGANARGVREVGCIPGRRPRLYTSRCGP